MDGSRRDSRTARRVRAESRAAVAVKAVLEAGDLGELPGSSLVDEGRTKAVISLNGLREWARRRGMDLRPHDAVELSRCLEVMGSVRGASSTDLRFGVPGLPYARDLWSEATSWSHDFEDDGRSWTGNTEPTPEGSGG